VFPLVLEADGNNYPIIFSNEERQTYWVPVPRHVLATTALPPLCMALNLTTFCVFSISRHWIAHPPRFFQAIPRTAFVIDNKEYLT